MLNIEINFTILVVGIINVILITTLFYPMIYNLQFSGYNCRAYLLKLYSDFKNDYINIIFLFLFSLVFITIFNYVFSSFKLISFLGILPLLYFILYYLNMRETKYNKISRLKIKYSNRMLRFLIVFFIVIFMISLELTYYFNELLNFYNYIGIISLIPFIPLIILLTNIILWPLENLIVLFDIYTAHKKISKHRKRLIVIGIMGTYGKSSVKDILTTGFKTKYNTCISPNNSNTIKGILRSIKYDLEDHHDILILELDIKKYINSKLIEKYIKFDYLIHTGKDVSKLDYIRDLKHMDIIEKNIINAVKEEGKLLINVNNDYSKEMLKKKYKTNIVPIDIDNEKSPIYLKNIKQGLDFTQFKFISAKCSIDTKTKLLGRQAVENIAISTYIFLDMNYQCGEIEQIITEIKTITGRLEYKTKDNNQHVIDNSKHNSINAFMSANQYIQALDFKNKILITSGIQNLNQTQVLQNMLISKNIYKSFTKCILIKNRTTEKLYKFLLEEGFDKKDIVVINSEEEVEKSLPKTDEESIILVNSL